MVRSLLRVAALGAAAFALPMPASAQHFSDSYQFLHAIRESDGTKVMEMLNEPGTQIANTRDSATGETALHIVSQRSDIVYMRFLLQHNGNPNITDNEGNTPMMIAVQQGWIEGVQTLIRYQGDVNRANNRGETPLIRAVQLRNLPLVRALLDAHANPDQADVIAGRSARDYALADNRAPAIRRLMEEAPRVQTNPNVMGPQLR